MKFNSRYFSAFAFLIFWTSLTLYLCKIALINGGKVSVTGEVPGIKTSIAVDGITPGSLTIRKEEGGRTTRTVLTTVSASGNGNSGDVWIDTGIEVSKGDLLTIEASGKVHLDIAGLIDAAKNDARPPLPWAGPDGFLDDYEKAANVIRKPLKLMPEKNMGCLICKVRSESTESEPFVVGERLTRHLCDMQGKLCFAVNDLLLKSIRKSDGTLVSAHDIYVPPVEQNESYYLQEVTSTLARELLISETSAQPLASALKSGRKTGKQVSPGNPLSYSDRVLNEYNKREKKWTSSILGAREIYSRVWFDDNIGAFYLSMKIESN